MKIVKVCSIEHQKNPKKRRKKMRNHLFVKIVSIFSLFLLLSQCNETEAPLQNKPETKVLLQSNLHFMAKSNLRNYPMTSFRYVEDENGKRYLEVLEGTTVMFRLKKGESISDLLKNSSNRLKSGQGGPQLSPTSVYEWHPNAPSINTAVTPQGNNPMPGRPNLYSMDYNEIFRRLDAAVEKGEDADLIEILSKSNN
jgi:hypothetical protein